MARQRQSNPSPNEVNTAATSVPDVIIDVEDLTAEPKQILRVDAATTSKMNSVFERYKEGKQNFEAKIIENDQWYRTRHMEIIKGEKDKSKENDPEPTTAYLFSTIQAKQADAMDNFPEANFIDRNPADEEYATMLSTIVPKILDRRNYKKTYANAWYYKLIHGVSCKGVFWNPSLEDNEGDIDIQKVDLLNLFWQPGVTDIQKSPYLFYGTVVHNDILKAQYPGFNDSGASQDLIKKYSTDDNIDTTDCSYVLDCYKKIKSPSGKTVTHLFKFVGDTVLVDTENDPRFAETGYYAHGLYPFVLDVLFPLEGTPIGFGFVDVLKNPQAYLDAFDAIITKNAFLAGQVRYLYKDSLQIDMNDFQDWSKPFIKCKGSVNVGENYAPLEVPSLDAAIINHRQTKISEMKDVAGETDFARGDTSGGVTAAGAIYALQQASQKTSRAMIGMSYLAFEEEMRLCVELIRQFYVTERTFKIPTPNGDSDYVPFDNSGLQPQPTEQMMDDNGLPMMDTQGTPVMNPEGEKRTPIFDIEVKAQKENPFSKEANNQMAIQLYEAGVFDPANALQAKALLEIMKFDGKEKVLAIIEKNDQTFQMIQAMQQQIMQMQGALTQVMGAQPQQQPAQIGGPSASPDSMMGNGGMTA